MSKLADALIDFLLYVIFSGFIQAVLQTIVAVGLLPLLFLRRPGAYSRIMVAVMSFNIALLLWGCVANVMWGGIARDRLYFAGDPLIEFFPYFPFGPWAYDYVWGQGRGHLADGVSLTQARCVWAAVASAVWFLSYLTFRKWSKRAAERRGDCAARVAGE